MKKIEQVIAALIMFEIYRELYCVPEAQKFTSMIVYSRTSSNKKIRFFLA